MKKSLAGVAVVFIVCTIITNYNICKNRKGEPISNNQVIKRDLLSYYKEDDSGNYILSTSSTWPTDGYLFNQELSRCENGSKLKWDSNTNTVVMSSSISDKCYIYFDKYILSEITGVSVSNVTDSSIKVTVASNTGTSPISKYYYSISTSNTTTNYIENSSNTYTFNSLEDGTIYYINVYALDSKNKITNTYTINQKTNYSKPVITNLEFLELNYPEFKFKIDIISKEEIKNAYIKARVWEYDSWGLFELEHINENIYSASIAEPCNGTTFKCYVETASGLKSDIFESSYTFTCFIAGTKILTINGYKNIEDIKINDKVYSYNEKTRKIEINKVNKIFIHEDTELFKIHLDKDIISVTPNHRFYVYRNGDYSWIIAKELKVTDKLLNNQNKHINIQKIEYSKENNRVYNFEVENNHTYYVSNENVLVHNAKGC